MAERHEAAVVRGVLSGYPVKGPLPLDQATAYRQSDPLICLRCGRPFVKLGHHLRRKHGMSKSEYCDLYGLPKSAGLVSPSQMEREILRAKSVNAIGTAIAANRAAGYAGGGATRSAYQSRISAPRACSDCGARLSQSAVARHRRCRRCAARARALPERQCAWCGERFHPSHTRIVCCSISCGQKHRFHGSG